GDGQAVADVPAVRRRVVQQDGCGQRLAAVVADPQDALVPEGARGLTYTDPPGRLLVPRRVRHGAQPTSTVVTSPPVTQTCMPRPPGLGSSTYSPARTVGNSPAWTVRPAMAR